MENKEQPTRFWIALRDYLDYLDETLPYAPEPDIVYFDHPDEEYKNAAQLEQIEEDHWDEANDLIAKMCETHNWPKKSKTVVRYCVSVRLKWAKRIVRVLAIPDSNTGEFVLPRPHKSGFDILRWLLTDAYEQRNPPPPKVPFIVSGADGTTATMWS